MLVTNEPGYYEDGAFGIRIENVMAVKRMSTPHRFGGLEYYGFEQITLVPYSLHLVSAILSVICCSSTKHAQHPPPQTQVSMLSPAQLRFVNDYHALVREKVGPLLKQQDDKAYHWLLKQTEPWK